MSSRAFPSTSTADCGHRGHRGSLRRRMFVSLVASMAVAVAATAGVGVVVSQIGDHDGRTDPSRWQQFLGKQLGAVWNDQTRRDNVLRGAVVDLDMSVTAYGNDGAVVFRDGEGCAGRRWNVDVLSEATRLGWVELCFRRPSRAPWGLAVFIGAFAAGAWWAAGRLARRLTRPLDELIAVVQNIGKGDLSARASLTHGYGDEVAAVSAAVNAMAERIEGQLKGHHELLAAVSHELRTPLSRMRLIIELARERGVSSMSWSQLETEIAEIDELVGELLTKSRLDFGSFQPRVLETQPLLARAVERAGQSTAVLVVASDAAHVSGDAALLARALANLVGNAVKHGGGVTQVTATRSGDRVRLEVQDSGPGLTEAARQTLFQPFAAGRAPGDGEGFGLSLVARIAAAHGGSAYARNRSEGGAAVGIEIPAGAL